MENIRTAYSKQYANSDETQRERKYHNSRYKNDT